MDGEGPGIIHPRLSINAGCTWANDLTADLAMWDAVGASQVGLWDTKIATHEWPTVGDDLRARQISVTSLVTNWFDLSDSTSWPGRRESLCRAIDAAVELDAGCVYLPAGPSDGRCWEALRDALAEAIEPCVEHAAARNARLAIEPSARLQVSFVNTLRDAVLISNQLGIDVIVDFASCWMERDLAGVLVELGSRIALVQVADVEIGAVRRPEEFDVRRGQTAQGRVVPGDGDLELERMLRATIAAGYSGPFELELLGPAIENEGYDSALPRGIARASELLDRVGA